MLLICVILMPIVVYSQMLDLNAGYNKFTLQIIPSLNKDKAHLYHIVAFCNIGETLYAKRNHSKSVQTPLIKNAPIFEDVITFMFDNEQCANYRIWVWLELEDDQNWITWPAAYKKEMIEKNIINHRIVFSNYFHLTISPTLEGHDIFYSIRVFCEESENHQKEVTIGEGSKKSAETFSNDDDYTKYKFKTYTKRTTMVIFNSEQPQCNNNTYHIKVWAMHKQWLYLYPTERPIVHYVCKSKGTGEKRNIYFMNHFQLTIEPKLLEDDEHIYYVEVRCYNNINEQTFKTITRGSTYVVLHKFSCEAYDIAAQKVPKKWTLQIELFKRAIEETKGGLESNVTINNGYTFIFDYEKCLNNWLARTPNLNAIFKYYTYIQFKNGSASKQKTDKEKFRTFIELSDDDEDENDNEEPKQKKAKKSEEKSDDCYYYYDD